MPDINELRAVHAASVEEMQEILDRADDSGKFTPEDEARFAELETEEKAAAVAVERKAKQDERVAKIKAAPEHHNNDTEQEVRVEVTSNEKTYRDGNAPGDHSYFSDLWRSTMRQDTEARDRLFRNNIESRDLTRTDTSSVGEFVPPAWLLELYQPGLRASRRVTANLCRTMSLPGGTDSINIPRISTNPTVAAQTADNAAVNEVDTVSATVTAAVVTFAGQNDVAIQVLEQSPLAGGFDALIFDELMRDLDRYVDVQVLNGTGTSGQVKGIVPVSMASGKKVAYTDSSATVPEMFPTFGQVTSQIVSARYENVEAFVMHPRRWYWLTSQVDSANRAYVVPTAGGPNNAYGTQSNGGVSQGPVGQILGIPVYLDPNVPVLLTNGAGTSGTEDTVIAGVFSDAILMESAVRTRILPEVLSGTLTTRLQVYEYAAFTALRANGVGFGNIYDTGMSAPTSY